MPKRGENIYKRRDGRWEGRFFAETKKTPRKYVSVYGHSYKEVKQKIAERRTRENVNTAITFDRVSREWLTDSRQRVKESTYQNYQYLLEKQILPLLSSKKMDEIDVGAINCFIREKSANGRLKNEGGISKKYLHDMVSIIKAVAGFCEQEYEIPDKIRNIRAPKVEKQERRLLDAGEQNVLKNRLVSNLSFVDLGILLSMYTGLRIGEVCGLRWEDYDSDEGILTVRRTVQRISDGNGATMLNVGTPKTQSSARLIPLPAAIQEILNRFKIEGKAYIITGTETVPEPAKLRRDFKKILKECGIPDIRFHDLRHIFASNCVRTNPDIKSLSEILGHASTSMTLNRYVHTTIEAKRAFMNSIHI